MQVSINKRKIKVAYVEDGDFYHGFKPVLKTGLDDGTGRVEVTHYPDFDLILQQIKEGKLDDVYILDNEIFGNETIYGADVALKIKAEAKKLGKEVLVLSLLSSNPGGIEKMYGKVFKKKGIPILFKLSHAAICAFFVGSCIRENKPLDFDNWMMREGITLPDMSNRIAIQVQNGLMVELEFAKGALFLKPRDFITTNLKDISRFMRPEAVAEMQRIFSTNQRRGIERRR